MAALRTATLQELRIGTHTVHVKERLAEGGFGFVDLVIDAFSKREMVLKRCNVDREESMLIVKKEINILQRFANQYMVNLIASDILQKNRTSREALLLMDFYPGGHLLDRLNMRNGSSLPSESAFRIFGQLLLSLKPLHLNNPPIVHRDLKLENILFGSDGKVRLCDFGSCVEGYVYLRNAEERQAAEEIISKETTLIYRAPELVDLYLRDVLTEKSDIWALGCILYTLCYLNHPFQNAGSLGILSAKLLFPAVSSVLPDTITVIQRMLDPDPEARPDILQLVDAVASLSAGRPLPPYDLTLEASTRRQERLAANEVRLKKAAAKKAPPPQPVCAKVVVAPASNSVAAKRLAALRGQPPAINATATTAANPNPIPAPSFSQVDEFDPFSTSTDSNVFPSASTPFEAFFNDNPIDSSSSIIESNCKGGSSVDPFDGPHRSHRKKSASSLASDADFDSLSLRPTSDRGLKVVVDEKSQSLDDSFDLLGLSPPTSLVPTPHSDHSTSLLSSPSRDLGFGYLGSSSGGSMNEYEYGRTSVPPSPAFAANAPAFSSSFTATAVGYPAVNSSSKPASSFAVDLLSLDDDYQEYHNNSGFLSDHSSARSSQKIAVDSLLDVDVDVSSQIFSAGPSTVKSSQQCEEVLKLFEQPPLADSTPAFLSPRPPVKPSRTFIGGDTSSSSSGSSIGNSGGGLYFTSHMSPPGTPNNNTPLNAYSNNNGNMQSNNNSRLILSTPPRQNQPPPIPARPKFPPPNTLPVLGMNMEPIPVHPGRGIPPMKPPKVVDQFNNFTAK